MISDLIVNSFTYRDNGSLTEWYKCNYCNEEYSYVGFKTIPEDSLAKRLMKCKDYSWEVYKKERGLHEVD